MCFMGKNTDKQFASENMECAPGAGVTINIDIVITIRINDQNAGLCLRYVCMYVRSRPIRP